MVDQKLLELSAKLFYRTINSQIINRNLDSLPDAEKLTQVQMACVRFAYLHPDSSVGDIADGLAISDAAAAKLIDRLVKRRLLLREEDSQDRRVLKIKPTEEGLRILELAVRREQMYFKEIIDRMSPEDLEMFRNGLNAFLKAALLEPEAVDDVCLLCGWEHLEECAGNLHYRELTGKNRSKI